MKWPGGKKFEDKFVETLKKYGYKGSYLSKEWLAQPAFIQSFAPTSLIYVSNQTDLPKIFLIDDVTVPTQDTNQVCVLPDVTSLGIVTQNKAPSYGDLLDLFVYFYAIVHYKFLDYIVLGEATV